MQLFFLNLDFHLLVSTRRYVPLKVLLIFHRVHFFAYFLEAVRGVILEFLLGERKRGRYGGSNLGGSYSSTNNIPKKGASWYMCSSKIGKTPEKYIWRSSFLVNQLYLKRNFLMGSFQEFCSNQKLTLFNL